MANWYYVVGSDRVGPVDVQALKQLFLNQDINNETYIWKKGFANWERLKDVAELDLTAVESVKAQPVIPQKIKPVVEVKEKEVESPEVIFSFNWNIVKEHDELFFIKIGKDRKGSANAEIYGPYSLVELKEALSEKRINLQTLIFSPGMGSWVKIQETPLNILYKAGMQSSVALNEVPLVLVFDYSPLPLITVVKKAGTKEGLLLGSGPFSEFQDKTIKATLYVGSEMKVKNVQVKIQSYDKKDQSMECQFIDLNQDAKKIMLNHAV